MSLGPIEIEVIRNALTAAAAEMDITIWRTSRSTTLKVIMSRNPRASRSI
jgi:N-methylhydantoinase B/oxoprolinase/acetone carboxylase alpha subunit